MDKHYLCYEHCVLKLSLNFTWSIKIRASTVKAMSCWSTGWPGLLSAAAGQCWSGHKQGTHVAIYTLMEHSRRHHNEHHASHHCGYEVCSGSYQDASQPLKDSSATSYYGCYTMLQRLSFLFSKDGSAVSCTALG